MSSECKETGRGAMASGIDYEQRELLAGPASNLRVTGSGEDDISRQLLGIWQELFGVESVGLEQNFFDLGGDSSVAVQMFARVDAVFKVELPLATLYDAPTVADLARIIRGETASSGWSPLVAIQPAGSRPPLFCMHGAGGNVLLYRDLSRHLGADQPFYGLQSQGLDGSSPPLTRIEEMAALYLKEIRRVQRHGPYYLGGYCGGGTIAFEIAQRLDAAGESVALLALFDTMNWSRAPLTPWDKASYTCQRLMFHAASFWGLAFQAKVRFFKGKMEVLRSRIPVWRGMVGAKLGKHPHYAPSNSLAMAEIWQANDRACWNYVPKPYRGKVTDFRPTKQYGIFKRPDLKWDKLAQGGQEIIVLPAYPAGMLMEPFVDKLALALRKSMDEAMSQHQPK